MRNDDLSYSYSCFAVSFPYSPNQILLKEGAIFISDSILLVPQGYCSPNNGEGSNCAKETIMHKIGISTLLSVKLYM